MLCSLSVGSVDPVGRAGKHLGGSLYFSVFLIPINTHLSLILGLAIELHPLLQLAPNVCLGRSPQLLHCWLYSSQILHFAPAAELAAQLLCPEWGKSRYCTVPFVCLRFTSTYLWKVAQGIESQWFFFGSVCPPH